MEGYLLAIPVSPVLLGRSILEASNSCKKHKQSIIQQSLLQMSEEDKVTPFEPTVNANKKHIRLIW